MLFVAGGCVYTLLALFCVLEFFRTTCRATSEVSPAPVSILKPIKGRDPELKENILSFCDQDYPDYEILLGFTDQADDALPIAEEIVSSRKDGRVRIVISRNLPGVNLKVANMQGLLEAARHPLVAVSDSDMRVGKGYLRKIVGEMSSRENVGVVTSLYSIPSPRSLGAVLESLSVALDFIPSVLVARKLEGVTFGLGASLLVPKKALDDIGGFSTVSDYLADDYQIGNRIWAKGYHIVLSKYVIEDIVGDMSVAGHLLHQLRWARTYRASRPKGYLGYGITHVFPMSLALLVLHPSFSSFAIVAVSLLLRTIVAVAVYKRVIRKPAWLRWLCLLPIRDVLSFLIWCWSFTGKKVYWRGKFYRIVNGGKIVEDGSN